MNSLSKEYFTNCRHHYQGADPHLFSPDTHEGFELLHVCAGSGHMIIDQQLFELEPRCLFFIDGRRFHYSNPEHVQQYIRSGIHVDQAHLMSFLETFGKSNFLLSFIHSGLAGACVHLSPEADAVVDTLFQEMKEENDARLPGYLPVIAGMLVRVIALAYRELREAQSPPLASRVPYTHVVNILAYVGDHLAEFTLDKMAKHLYMSKYYLAHLFKEITGLTIHKYLMEKRMEVAEQKLVTTNAPISEIAMDLGFSSFSVFSRNFHLYVGMTPRAYRQAHQDAFEKNP